MLGAVLIIGAATSVFVAHRGATNAPAHRIVVATVDVAAGATLSEDHLGTIAIDVPSGLGVVEEADVQALVGRTLRRPLSAMDPLRHSDVFESGRFTSPDGVEVALELDRGAALADTLTTGDVVDVLSTDPDSEGTTTAISAAVVTAIGAAGDDSIGATGRVPVRLSVPDSAAAQDLVDAAVRTQLTLVLPAPGGSER